MIAEANEKIKTEPFLTNNSTTDITPLNGICSEEGKFVYASPDSFTVNPAFTIESVKYVFVQSDLYEGLDWRELITAVFGDASEVISFPLDVTTPRSVLRGYDGAIVACRELANELCNKSGRLQFVTVIRSACVATPECLTKI